MTTNEEIIKEVYQTRFAHKWTTKCMDLARADERKKLHLVRDKKPESSLLRDSIVSMKLEDYQKELKDNYNKGCLETKEKMIKFIKSQGIRTHYCQNKTCSCYNPSEKSNNAVLIELSVLKELSCPETSCPHIVYSHQKGQECDKCKDNNTRQVQARAAPLSQDTPQGYKGTDTYQDKFIALDFSGKSSKPLSSNWEAKGLCNNCFEDYSNHFKDGYCVFPKNYWKSNTKKFVVRE